MPQLDGPASVCARRRQPVPEVRRKTIIPGGGYPDESDSDSHDNRSHEGQRYPGRRRHYQDRGGRPPDREDNQDRGYPRRGRPLDDGGPLMMEDPQEMEDHQDDLKDKDHQAHQGLLTSAPYNCTTTPGYFRYYCSGKHIWYGWPVNVTIGKSSRSNQ